MTPPQKPSLNFHKAHKKLSKNPKKTTKIYKKPARKPKIST
jgi:hypothetical protein